MANATIKVLGDGHFLVEGELNAMTVPDLWRAASGLIKGVSGTLLFDLKGVGRSDSAGVALLIDWMRQARDRQLEIKFQNLPEQMWEIARVSDLDQVIPLAE